MALSKNKKSLQVSLDKAYFEALNQISEVYFEARKIRLSKSQIVEIALNLLFDYCRELSNRNKKEEN